MNTVSWTLDLDFGEVGWKQTHRFAVRLDASRLRQLMADAALGSRVYALVTMRRKGDIWPWLDVRPIALPPRVQGLWAEAHPYQPADELRMAFEVFDGQFFWSGDDTEPEDAAWRGNWDGPQTQAFSASLFEQVRHVIQGLDGLDEVMTHELARIRKGEHAYDGWPRGAVFKHASGSIPSPHPPSHAAGFHEALEHLLRKPEIEAVRYRGEGDYRLLRQLCNAQRRRADAQGVRPGQALHLSALCNRRIDNPAWDSAVHFYDEGLGWGDLHIEGDGDFGAPLRRLVGTPWQRFGRRVLSARDLGDLPGYSCEIGEGWALYTAWSDTPVVRPPREDW